MLSPTAGGRYVAASTAGPNPLRFPQDLSQSVGTATTARVEAMVAKKRLFL